MTNPQTTPVERQCVYCGVSYSHSLDCKRLKIETLLSDAMDCLRGETPEDMSAADAKEMVINRIQKWLRYGEIE